MKGREGRGGGLATVRNKVDLVAVSEFYEATVAGDTSTPPPPLEEVVRAVGGGRWAWLVLWLRAEVGVLVLYSTFHFYEGEGVGRGNRGSLGVKEYVFFLCMTMCACLCDCENVCV